MLKYICGKSKRPRRRTFRRRGLNLAKIRGKIPHGAKILHGTKILHSTKILYGAKIARGKEFI